RLVQLIDHETDHLFALLGNHADAVALSETAEEVLLVPGEFETGLFRLQNLGHITADHPANMDARLFFFRTTRAHERIPPPRLSARNPPHGCTALSACVPIEIGGNRLAGLGCSLSRLAGPHHRRILAMLYLLLKVTQWRLRIRAGESVPL